MYMIVTFSVEDDSDVDNGGCRGSDVSTEK